MKKSGFLKDALILFIITLISGLSLGFVYNITKAPIEAAKLAAKSEAYKQVFMNADSFAISENADAVIEASADEISAAGFGNVSITEVVEALDANKNVMGHIVSVTSKDGYGGDVSISVGISSEKIINGIAFLEINETPGLGMNATQPEFYTQFSDKEAGTFKVTKNPTGNADEINAISGATITSNAVTNSVNAAIYFVTEKLGE